MRDRRNKSLLFFIATAMLIFLIPYYKGDFKSLTYDKSDNKHNSNKYKSYDVSNPNTTKSTPDIILSKQAEIHILYGDSKGGGHIYGSKKPCKSLFPKSWDSEKIISTVKELAANDNLEWQAQNNNRYVAEDIVDNIIVRVVMGSKRKKVITAYPLNTQRTPCPIKNKRKNKNNRKTLEQKNPEQDNKSIFDNIKIEYKHDYNH